MPYRCEVLTPWFYDATRNTNEQAIALDYPAVWSDVTGQPDENIVPAPNVFISQGEGLTVAQMDALDTDANYVVLWSEETNPSRSGPIAFQDGGTQAAKPPDELPTASEHGQMIAALARLGVKGALVSELASSKSRRVNATILRTKLRNLPKAK